MAKLPVERPVCLGCDREMILSGDRWLCPECGWWLPNRDLCPRCWTALPADTGPGGEKVCPTCRYELWPPRDGEPRARERTPREFRAPAVTLTMMDAGGNIVHQVRRDIYRDQPRKGPHGPEPVTGLCGAKEKGKGSGGKTKRKKGRKPLRRKPWGVGGVEDV